MSAKTSVGLYIDKDFLSEVDLAMQTVDCASRNEFIIRARRFYITFLNRGNYSDILTPAYESVVGGKIKDTETKISRVLFKQSVELAMLMNIVAATNHISEDSLHSLRKLCVEEVKRLNGGYSLEDAVRQQNV